MTEQSAPRSDRSAATTPNDALLTQLQEVGWCNVGGLSLAVIYQMVDQLGLMPNEVIITRHGELEIVHKDALA